MTDTARKAALLKWQLEAGADEAILNEPQNRFADSMATGETPPPAEAPAAVSRTTPSQKPPPPAAAQTAAAAQDIAGACRTLDELFDAIRAFDGCALKETATNTVIHDGSPAARIMVIGEAPGSEEDRCGLPFVGAAGRLLDRMLAAIGLDRESTYITNIVYWRPPGNRNPTPDEIALCMPFTRRQIELIKPHVLVPVGAIAAKALFETTVGITRLRGNWHDFTTAGLDHPIPALATFHPAYLLRQPLQKREVWRDLLAVREKLSEAEITKGPS